MFVSVPLNICIQHPCIICPWGCSPGGEDDSYLCVCVCVCVLSDGASREEVRQAYPDSPSDDHSLDIQQQALLRQQKRTINSLRRGRAAGQSVIEDNFFYIFV